MRSSVRTDDDTWDIATSVGMTAVIVAAARAYEAEGTEPLIRDPYARLLVDGADVGGRHDAAAAPQPDLAAAVRSHLSYQAVRSLFFDTFLTEAAEAGIRQIVLLASGLDSRAYRLKWPAGTVVFEIDQPGVLEYKSTVLAEHGVEPTAGHRHVGVDLRQDWPAALTGAGLDPSRPTAWLAEGLLWYLPADAQDRLFELITTLSAPGSRLATESVPYHDEKRRELICGHFDAMTDYLGLRRTEDITALSYNDPERADVVEWLTTHGWNATGTRSAEEMRRHGRLVGVPSLREAESYSTFVIAERRVRAQGQGDVKQDRAHTSPGIPGGET